MISKNIFKYEDLINIIENEIGFKIDTKSRKEKHVIARCIYYDLAYNILKMGGLEEVGSVVGKDHSSVLHSLSNLNDNLDEYFRGKFPQLLSARDRLLFRFSYFSNKKHAFESPIQDAVKELRKTTKDLKRSLNLDGDTWSEVYGMIKDLDEDQLKEVKVRLEPIITMVKHASYNI